MCLAERTRRCWIPALLLLLAGALRAEASDAGLLWEIQGQHNRVYLLGSVHMLRESDFPLPAAIEGAYEDAEVLVMELDMDDLNPLHVQSLFFRHGTLMEGQTLADVLGPANYAEARTAALALDIDLDMLARVKPWRAALTVVQLQLARLGFDPQLGLEGHFTGRAAEDGKPIEGLESPAFQVALFDGMSMDRQVDMLLKSLADAATIEEDINRLVAAWRAGHVEQLAAMQNEAFADFPALYASLIRDRNVAWTEHLAELLQDRQDYLVLVGALHLVGADGVPAGLGRLGFEVRRR